MKARSHDCGTTPVPAHASNAASPSSGVTSRRGFFLSTIAAVASASAVPTPALAIVSESPDAELIALGNRLEPIILEWLAQSALDDRRTAAHDNACEQAGLPRLEYGSVSDEEWRARGEERLRVNYPGKDEGSDADWNHIHDRQWPLIDDILSRRAQTLSGFAIQVRAFTLAIPEYWDGDYSETAEMAFVEAACGYAGVTPVRIELDQGVATPSIAAAAPPINPDPIFAAIERYKLAEAAFLRRSEWEDAQEEAGISLEPAAGDHQTPEMVACVDESIAAREGLWRTAPTTPAGLVAYLDYVVAASEERDGPELSGEAETMDFLRTLARATRGMAGQLKPRNVDSGEDPIFAAIAAHRQAWKNLGGLGRDLEAADWVPEEKARAALVNPTTNAGAAALLRYIHDHQKDNGAVGGGSYNVWAHSVYLNVADALEGRVAS